MKYGSHSTTIQTPSVMVTRNKGRKSSRKMTGSRRPATMSRTSRRKGMSGY